MNCQLFLHYNIATFLIPSMHLTEEPYFCRKIKKAEGYNQDQDFNCG
jgi:hypothetical protein